MPVNEESSEYTGAEIAVIGMAGRFPGARNIDEFRANIREGKESLSFLTEAELEELGVPPEQYGAPGFVKTSGGQLTGKESFDAAFFDYTPREAEVMDPQTRIFHECAWAAMENAGYAPIDYAGTVGVYAGASSSSYWENLSYVSGKSDVLGEAASKYLSSKDFLATRIAYKLNLRGPGLTLQTACSTSLVAIHLACQAILNGECNMAMAGGVTLSPKERAGYLYTEGILSPDGHCRAFDATAAGTAMGEGVGIVLLKALDEALEEGDHIYAIVKGTAINNDGIMKIGYTAPAPQGQADAISMALRVAEVEPESIGYIEAHGTGTVLGDPVEITGLKSAFDTDKKGYCAIGSVKTNIGHLDAAAGVAGFIKTVLALFHKELPPSLHFETPNPKIDFENSPFYVNTRLKEWESDGTPLRAGVSSFGIGGTNAHAVLEEAPVVVPGVVCNGADELEYGEIPGEREYKLLLVSAKTQSALDRYVGNLAAHLESHPDLNLADTAYTLQTGRRSFKHRCMTVSRTATGAAEALAHDDPEKVFVFSAKEQEPEVVFMFPGQGPQYENMGWDLYRTEPVFREEVDRCFEILTPLMGREPGEIL